MKKLLFLITITLLLYKNANACINEYATNAYGYETEEWVALPVFYKDFNKSRSESFLEEHKLQDIHTFDFGTQSDIAVHMARLGHFKKSLEILKKLYKQYPNEYKIVANLGTLYELNGLNEEALSLIKKAIKINPEAHNGSEWFHVKVLEAKLKLEKDAHWLLKNKVLDLDITSIEKAFGNAGTLQDSILSKYEDTLFQIQDQLKERIPFTPTPDLLMANILSETAELFAKEKSVVSGYILYHIGLQYDPEDHYQIKEKIKELRGTIEKLKLMVPLDEEIENHFKKDDGQQANIEYGGPPKIVTADDTEGETSSGLIVLGVLGLAGLICGIILIRRI